MLNAQIHLRDPHPETPKDGQVEQKGKAKGKGADTSQTCSKRGSVEERRKTVVADIPFSQEETQ